MPTPLIAALRKGSRSAELIRSPALTPGALALSQSFNLSIFIGSGKISFPVASKARPSTVTVRNFISGHSQLWIAIEDVLPSGKELRRASKVAFCAAAVAQLTFELVLALTRGGSIVLCARLKACCPAELRPIATSRRRRSTHRADTGSAAFRPGKISRSRSRRNFSASSAWSPACRRLTIWDFRLSLSCFSLTCSSWIARRRFNLLQPRLVALSGRPPRFRQPGQFHPRWTGSGHCTVTSVRISCEKPDIAA